VRHACKDCKTELKTAVQQQHCTATQNVTFWDGKKTIKMSLLIMLRMCTDRNKGT